MGDALIRVNWNPLTRTAQDAVTTNTTVVPIFSNFQKWQDSTLDRLIHDGRIVDEITIRAGVNADDALTLGAADGKLFVNATEAVAIVTYTDGTSIETPIASSVIDGKFVGSSNDGPLGILGNYTVPEFAGTTDLEGSFGADLTSFETLLTP